MAERNIKEIDLIAVYDCFSMTALMQIEDMGFCGKGEGGSFIANQRLHFDNPRKRGGIPCNTHGGLLSHAYVLGMAHIIELIRQLRDHADNQVEDAREVISDWHEVGEREFNNYVNDMGMEIASRDLSLIHI